MEVSLFHALLRSPLKHAQNCLQVQPTFKSLVDVVQDFDKFLSTQTRVGHFIRFFQFAQAEVALVPDVDCPECLDVALLASVIDDLAK